MDTISWADSKPTKGHKTLTHETVPWDIYGHELSAFTKQALGNILREMAKGRRRMTGGGRWKVRVQPP